MPLRPITKIHTTSDFKKSFQKLPSRIQDLAGKKDQWFRVHAFDPRLQTHKLHGSLEGYWSYSVNAQYRVLFRFVADNEVLYYDIGTHEIYR